MVAAAAPATATADAVAVAEQAEKQAAAAAAAAEEAERQLAALQERTENAEAKAKATAAALAEKEAAAAALQQKIATMESAVLDAATRARCPTFHPAFSASSTGLAFQATFLLEPLRHMEQLTVPCLYVHTHAAKQRPYSLSPLSAWPKRSSATKHCKPRPMISGQAWASLQARSRPRFLSLQ